MEVCGVCVELCGVVCCFGVCDRGNRERQGETGRDREAEEREAK